MTGLEHFPLPEHPDGTDWPTEAWPEGDPGAHVDRKRLDVLLDYAFAEEPPEDIAETHALLVVQNGKLVTERYWKDHGPDQTFKSWSMAKSITHALIGILVREGMIDIHGPADVLEWKEPGDPRGAITLDQLLRMSSGLRFVEEYVEGIPSDVREMLYGSGRPDTAAFAASFPLEHEPGSFWSYSSGTTNIVARIAKRALDTDQEGFEAFMREELFEPIGMTSPNPWFDDAGTFIGSSFCFASARDFARFGTLYLRDGVWDGRRILPEGWVDYVRTPTPQPETHDGLGYGAHWWRGIAGPKSFSANGYQGQFTVLEPELDLVLVRHGDTIGDEETEALKAWIAEVVDCFRQ